MVKHIREVRGEGVGLVVELGADQGSIGHVQVRIRQGVPGGEGVVIIHVPQAVAVVVDGLPALARGETLDGGYMARGAEGLAFEGQFGLREDVAGHVQVHAQHDARGSTTAAQINRALHQ